MVEIISKRSGPSPQDARLRRILHENRATITRIADHMTLGAYSASKSAGKAEAKPEGLVIHDLGRVAPSQPRPVVRISLNGRVIVVDDDSGRQLHHLGDLRRRDGSDVFVLATEANGFFSPLDGDMAGALADLDGARFSGEDAQESFAAEIARRLAYG